VNPLIRPWRHYADFRGRSRRLEYGLFLATFYGVGFGGSRLGHAINASHGIPHSRHLPTFISIPCALFFLAAIVPLVAVTVRRLHDIGVSGWWLMIILCHCSPGRCGYPRGGVSKSIRPRKRYLDLHERKKASRA